MASVWLWSALLVFLNSRPTPAQDTVETYDGGGSIIIYPDDERLQEVKKPTPLPKPKATPSLTTTTVPSPPNTTEHSRPGCELPSYPHNRYKLIHCIGNACSPGPGQHVVPFQLLNLTCDQDYVMRVRGDHLDFSLFYCMESTREWSKPIPECFEPKESFERGESCAVPDYPSQVRDYSLFRSCLGPACNPLPGQWVPYHAVVDVICNVGYVHAAGYSPKLTCIDGQWVEKIPFCAKPCPTLSSSPTMKVECNDDYGWAKYKCKQATYNNTARFTCEETFVLKMTDDSSSFTCGEDGRWSAQLPTCEPKCGISNLKSGSDSSTSVERYQAEVGDFPWHAAIYQKKWESVYNFQCSGTLITTRHILTDARCVTRVSSCSSCKARPLSPREVLVALGKIGRNWATPESRADRKAVKSINIFDRIDDKVEEDFQIIFEMRGSLNLKVALLVLESEVTVNGFVRPVCIDYDNRNFNETSSLSRHHGYIPGWGRGVECKPGERCEGTSSLTLQYEHVTTHVSDWEECYESMLYSNTTLQPQYYGVMCTGDGKDYRVLMNGHGAGLVYKRNDQYFIVGIFMEEFKRDNTSFGIFINLINSHIKGWIARIIRETTDMTTCKLPDYYNNVYQLQGECSGFACTPRPGDKVSDKQLVIISCQHGYHMSLGLSSDYSVCDRGNWSKPIPPCDNTCPPLFSSSLNLNCYQGTRDVSCSVPQPTDTTVRFTCKEHYKLLSSSGNPAFPICRENGTWSRDLPTCQPNCGESDLSRTIPQPAIYGGGEAKTSNFPWNAAIFIKENGTWSTTVKCGGTLVSTRAILTAAHCVTETNYIAKPAALNASDVAVALGKTYRQWGHNEDSEVNATVKEIITFHNYRGSARNFYGDIAILLLDSEVEVNRYTMPVCTDLNKLHVQDFSSVTLGYVVGWGRITDCALRGEFCGDYSDTLQYATTPIVPYHHCTDRVQSPGNSSLNLRPELAADKFCSGDGKVSVIQQGDSGSGLVYRYNNQFFIHGVASYRLKTKDNISFSAYTNVTEYSVWMSNILTTKT